MRKVVIGIALMVVLLVGLEIALIPRGGPQKTSLTIAKPKVDPPSSTQVDPVEIFQKAFWKRPTAEDKIHHAERREWADAGGVKKWQWFIVVEPSPELLKHLRDDNAFALKPATDLPAIRDAPDWFSFDPGSVEIMTSPNNHTMSLLFSKTKRLLHATGAGGGFHAGVAEPDSPQTEAPSTNGRLPLTRPPVRDSQH